MHYQLKRSLNLPISLANAWDFFSDPRNLTVITPPTLGLRITSEITRPVYAGQIITYKVSPLLSIPMTWVTEITHVREPYYFVDEQRYGPYRMWHHQHILREEGDGVITEDIVDYIMPAGPLGGIIHKLFVTKQIEGIFDYRQRVLQERFGGKSKA